MTLPVPRKNAERDDAAIARMSAWLVKNKMVGLTTLSGRLTVMTQNEAAAKMLFDGGKPQI